MGNPTEFREVIEKAESKAGGTLKLAETIQQPRTAISDAKAGRRGLPDEACEKLAELAQMDFGDVIRARMRQRGFANVAVLIATLAGAAFVNLLLTSQSGAALGAGFSGLYDLCIHYATKAKKFIARIRGKAGLACNTSPVLYMTAHS